MRAPTNREIARGFVGFVLSGVASFALGQIALGGYVSEQFAHDPVNFVILTLFAFVFGVATGVLASPHESKGGEGEGEPAKPKRGALELRRALRSTSDVERAALRQLHGDGSRMFSFREAEGDDYPVYKALAAKGLVIKRDLPIGAGAEFTLDGEVRDFLNKGSGRKAIDLVTNRD